MPSFTYNQNIPAASNLLSDDQPNMATNTNSLFSLLGGDSSVDMIGFGDADGGWHRQLTYVVQASAPGSASGQARTYSKTDGGNSEIFLQRDNVATEIQLTKGTPTAASKGLTFLPGGLLLQWMDVSIATTTGSDTFLQAFTTLYNVTIGPQQGTTMWVSASSVTGVTITRSGSGPSGCWVMAIGV